jgi:tetratricopeptide (TPR) repeat protein
MADKLYYLGAGASANAIPVIAKLKRRVKEIQIYLDGLYKTNKHSKAIELYEKIDEISSCFKVLLRGAENYQSIDTYAFFLYRENKRRNEYEDLKKALIVYFSLEQMLLDIPGDEYWQQIDQRYQSLIPLHIQFDNSKTTMLSPLHVISWNYDVQIELTLSLLKGIGHLNDVKENFNIHPNKLSYNATTDLIFDDSQFNIIKLNGNAFIDTSLELGGKVSGLDGMLHPHSNEQKLNYFLDIYSKEYTNKGGSGHVIGSLYRMGILKKYFLFLVKCSLKSNQQIQILKFQKLSMFHF